jgi:hypothetical protein
MSRNPVADRAAIEPPGYSAVLPSLLVTALLSLAIGYWLGKGDTIRYFTGPRRPLPKLSSTGIDFEITGTNGDTADDECKLVLPIKFYPNSGFGGPHRSRNGQRKSCIFISCRDLTVIRPPSAVMLPWPATSLLLNIILRYDLINTPYPSM